LHDAHPAQCDNGLPPFGTGCGPRAPSAGGSFPLDFEAVLKPDGARKNECERNAAKRLCAALYERYGDLQIQLVENALYANAPHIRQITSYNWKYVLNVKPDSQHSLEKQFAGRQARGQVKERWQRDAQGVQHYFAWTNDLCLCDSALDVKVNYLLYEQTDKQGRVLKNQGYDFEHNYGHGLLNLATVLALLLLLAFTVDQIQQHCWKLFRQVRAGLRTKAKLWDSLRSLFKVLCFRTMTALYRQMAYQYDIQLK
jgi:hypothetical protein